ncbi:MAG TPA: adenylate/guanylate cyclase domain-containing protein [Nevskiaceae bacterium]|nr:adenylate/guanylate cyclase domain-containing protein [Nevskiaceae bacterium]
MSRSLIRFALSLAVFLPFLLHSAGWLPLRLLETVENFTYDARVRLSVSGTPHPRLVVLDVDERTLAVEGWPWPRRRWAELIDTLFDHYQPAVVGFDIAFAEPDRSSGRELLERLRQDQLADLPGFAERTEPLLESLDYDRRFGESLRGRPVVLGYFFKQQIPEGEPPVTGTLCPPLMERAAAALYDVDFIQALGHGGNVGPVQAGSPYCGFYDNATVDADGVYRRVPLVQQYQGALYPSLALAVARLALGDPPLQFEFEPPDARTSLNLEQVRLGPVTIPVDGDVAAYVPYRGGYRTLTYVSALDVLQRRTDPAVLRESIVLIGTSAAGLLDLRTTPVGGAFAGVEVHANLVAGILDGQIRQRAPYYSGIEVTLLFVFTLVMGLLFPRVSPLMGAALALGLIGTVLGLAFGLWSGAQFVMPMGVPVLFVLALFMVHLLYGYFIESRGKRDISKLFGQYVPPELVEEMAAHPEAISMEGESRAMTVLFSDVRGFTSISEKLDAKELSQLMNRFLTQQTGVIQRHRGTIDKYMGDAIMAFWGAPLADPEHARRALEAALEMVRAVRELDEEFAQRGWPPLNIGVGLNTGKMNVGNMGSSFRVAYTVMGDSVNLGSRVEGLTKEYGVAVICTEFTRNDGPSDWAYRELDRVRVKGKNEPVAIYEPLGPKEALAPALREDLARHRGAMKLYRAQLWDQAETEFFQLLQSGRPHRVYELFLERILYLRENPPGANWDGAFTFTHK